MSGAAEQQADVAAELALSKRSVVYRAFNFIPSARKPWWSKMCFVLQHDLSKIKWVCKAVGPSARKGCKTDITYRAIRGSAVFPRPHHKLDEARKNRRREPAPMNTAARNGVWRTMPTEEEIVCCSVALKCL